MFPRWQVKATYRTDLGPIGVIHDIEEISDLAPLIEAGPHWDTIVSVEIARVNHSTSADLTVEQAAEL